MVTFASSASWVLGPLPNDRSHQGKIFGNYSFDNGLNFGLGLFLSSGQPLTALAANPAYDSPGEIPETPRGEGFDTLDGFKTRTPIETSFDFHADYGIRMGGQKLTFMADIFNLFDSQTVVSYDSYTESSFTAENPDFGLPYRYQTPRQIRLGLRLRVLNASPRHERTGRLRAARFFCEARDSFEVNRTLTEAVVR